MQGDGCFNEPDTGAALAYFNSSKRSGMLVNAGPVFWVSFCGAILILAIAASTALMVDDFRDRALNGSERELNNTVLLLVNHFDQQIEDFESIQRSIAAQIEEDIRSPQEFENLLSTEDFHRTLKGKVNATADFAGVNVWDAKGNLINSSERWPTPSLNLSDRKYFQAFRSGTTKNPVLIELVQSRVSQGQTVVIARSVTSSKGEFLGMVTRSIPPTAFEKFFSSIILEKGSVALLHQDGTLLARYPHVETMAGRNFAGGPLFSKVLDEDGDVTTQFISPIDGQERLGSFRKLAKYPLLVVATLPVETALADWRKQTKLLIWVADLAAAVVGLMAFLITRYLKAKHRQLDAAVSNMTQSLLLFDASERLVVCNKRYIEMFGLSSEIVRPGCKFRDIIQHRKDTGSLDGDVDEYCDSFRVSSKNGQATQSIHGLPDGRWVRLVYQPLAHGGWLATIEDVTAQRRSEELNERLAKFDALTELPNRAFLLQHLRQTLDQSGPNAEVAVLFLDTDQFKTVNDSLGHHIGDELLRSMARNLKTCLGPNEFAARLGGDEFAVIASGIRSRDQVVELVERIHAAIRLPHECSGHRLTIDSSIGIAVAPKDGTNCDQILQNADLAMYEAKAAGRRIYRFFEPGMESNARDRLILEADLRKAIEDEQIEIHYQPIIDLRQNEIVACEALARWKHPERGFVPPAEFIPAAEQSGLIHQLGDYILRKACKEASVWPERIKLAVNVSPVQFKSNSFALKVISALGGSGLSPRRLELEITETVLIDDDETAIEILHELRAIGIYVALDDFGTGYSSLSYLRRFPFDKIKIDRVFIDDLGEDNGSRRIVRAIVSIAAAHGMTVTAEGVETEQQRNILRRLRCDEMQGFVFSAARTAIEIRPMLSAAQPEGLVAAGNAFQ
jgi:diguanylate cyclase (GGDEF)-like protein